MRNGQTLLRRILLTAVLLLQLQPIQAQTSDVDALLSLIELGQLDSAETLLSELSFSNPGHPGIRYARALMQTDALLAAGIYKDIVRNDAGSKYFPGSLLRLGEYYFALGLYVQSRQHLIQLVLYYPEFPQIEQAVNLSLRAGIAARQLDSVYIDLAQIVRLYPDRKFDIPQELDLTRLSPRKPVIPIEDPGVAPLRTLGEPVSGDNRYLEGAFTLQAGAFGSYDNARKLADQIESIGYSTKIKERNTTARTLFLVWVGDYPDRAAALSAADILEAALGVGTFPVEID